MDQSLILFIEVALGIILLISWFILASNVSALKKHVCLESRTSKDLFSESKRFYFRGDIKEALGCYLDGVYLEFENLFEQSKHTINKELPNLVKQLEEKHSEEIKSLGGSFPDINSYMQKYYPEYLK